MVTSGGQKSSFDFLLIKLIKRIKSDENGFFISKTVANKKLGSPLIFLSLFQEKARINGV